MAERFEIEIEATQAGQTLRRLNFDIDKTVTSFQNMDGSVVGLSRSFSTLLVNLNEVGVRGFSTFGRLFQTNPVIAAAIAINTVATAISLVTSLTKKATDSNKEFYTSLNDISKIGPNAFNSIYASRGINPVGRTEPHYFTPGNVQEQIIAAQRNRRDFLQSQNNAVENALNLNRPDFKDLGVNGYWSPNTVQNAYGLTDEDFREIDKKVTHGVMQRRGADRAAGESEYIYDPAKFSSDRTQDLVNPNFNKSQLEDFSLLLRNRNQEELRKLDQNEAVARSLEIGKTRAKEFASVITDLISPEAIKNIHNANDALHMLFDNLFAYGLNNLSKQATEGIGSLLSHTFAPAPSSFKV